jgi:hypothetical protein
MSPASVHTDTPPRVYLDFAGYIIYVAAENQKLNTKYQT